MKIISSAAAAGVAVEDSWKELPDLLLQQIAEELLEERNFVAFSSMRAVCKGWREDSLAVLQSIKKRPQWPRAPLLLLSNQNEVENEFESEIGIEQGTSYLRQCYSILTKRIVFSVYLHRAQGRRLLECRFGWLLTLGDMGAASLLNPFSGQEIRLPRFDNYTRHRVDQPFDIFIIRRGVLSSNPSTSPVFFLGICTPCYFGYWRSGTQQWITIAAANNFNDAFQDVCFSSQNDSFYALSGRQELKIWKFSPTTDVFDVLHFNPLPANLHTLSFDINFYIVECGTQFLVLAKNGAFPYVDSVKKSLSYGTTNFLVFKADFPSKELLPVFELNHALFIGHNASMSVPSDEDNGIQKAIYFTDDSVEAYSGAYFPDYGDQEGEIGGWEIEDLGISSEDVVQEIPGAEAELKSEIEEIPGVEGDLNSEIEEIPGAWRWGKGKLNPLLGGGRNSGIYRLDDGTIERLDAPDTRSRICPPLWLSFPPQLDYI